MKIVADEAVPFLRGVLEPYAEISYMPASAIDAAACRNADALIVRTRTKCDAGLLAGSCVGFIGTATIGTDHIDRQYCASRGIKVANAPGCNSSAVMQYVATALLKVAEMHDIDLKSSTLGVIGVGHVGRKVKRVAEWMGMKVLLNDPPLERLGGSGMDFVSLGKLLDASDMVTLHVPLDESTYGMVGSEFFMKLGKGKVFINASRGDVVKGPALLEYSASAGSIVLDVWPGEPRISRELIAAADIATPHVAGYSKQGKINGTTAVITALAKRFSIVPLTGFSLPPASVKISSPAEIPGLYDIMADDAALRAHPEEFESLRNKYYYRNEFYF
ncbi:MAG: 4-phosphoerythronate dehydrogenase [Bacteroidales bacterium]|jgi:erythronate-4-phosphate dehydrogenase|nr:4-phosphoerythronate dehydrogenase [Bacteroidales bacterium]MCI2121614.1 4-phosphoerythronate dehydrogenase [Bacteroidales bacterium]MCI2144707.1 4-phosphoerythronate dehydrogenase [Bacteroidales bacterium]